MTEFFGTTAFLVGNAIWFLVWLVWNSKLIPGLPIFDPEPFTMLTTAVSLEAIFLSIFVLMAQNRAEKVDELRAEVTLQVDTISELELTKLIQVVARIAEKVGVDLSDDKELQDMIAPTNLDEIADILEAEIAPKLSKQG
ncbi:MAG: DUF1003 domain-containing protein [Kofleriaceae bacterium]